MINKSLHFDKSFFTFALQINIKHTLKINKNKMAKVIRLKPEFVEAIKANPELQGKIAQAVNRSVNAIYRWTAANNSQLTMLAVLIEIRTFLKLRPDTVLTEHVEMEEPKGEAPVL